MAQLALTIGGSMLGGYFGGPLGAQVGALAGSIVGGVVDSLIFGQGATPAPKIGDTKVQASTYGNPVARPYGTIGKLAGNLIWSTRLIPHEVQTSVGGGSGLGGGTTGISIRYTVSCAVGVCKPIGAFTRIWADKKIIWDSRSVAKGRVNHRGAHFRFYLGDETQLPDPTIQAHEGTALTPAYRGLAYVVIKDLQLDDFADHIPQFEFEIVNGGASAQPYLSVTAPAAANVPIGFDRQRGYVYAVGHDGGGEYVVSKIRDNDGALLLTGPEVFPGSSVSVWGCVVGRDGNVYIQPASNFAPVIKLDQVSLAPVDSAGSYGVSSGPIAIQGACIPRNGYLLLCGYAGNMTSWGLTILDEGDALPPPLNLFPNKMRIVSRVGTATPQFHVTYADFDSAGNVWATVPDPTTGNLHLYKMQLTDNGIDIGSVGDGAGAGNPIVVLEDIDLSSDFASPSAVHPNFSACVFIESMNALLVALNNSVILFDLGTETVTETEFNLGTGVGAVQWTYGPDDTTLVLYGPAAFEATVFDIAEWAIVETVPLGAAALPSAGNTVYDAATDAIWATSAAGGALFEMFLHRRSSATALLSDIVTAECAVAGLDSSLIDVSSLTSTVVRGYVVARQTAIKDSLAPLMTAFFFDAVESDGKIKFIKRGGASAATIDKADAGAYAGSQRPDPIIRDIMDDIELTRRILARYVNPGREYQDDAAAAKRFQVVTASKVEKTIELPIVFHADEAQEIVERLLYLDWLSRETFSLAVSRKFLYLDPADVITMTKDGSTFVARLTQGDYGADGVYALAAVAEDPSIYLPLTTPEGAGALGGIPDPGGSQAPTLLILMDIPALRDADNDAGFYLAAGGLDDRDWPGVVVVRSADNGETYQSFETIATAACLGSAVDALASPRSWGEWDRVNTVTVRPTSDSSALVSASEINVLNGANAALLGDEVIQFATVTDNGNGTFTLSDLIRGRRGTDLSIGTHVAGERFVLLTGPGIKDAMQGSGQIGLTRQYKALEIGVADVPDTVYSFIDSGKRLWPYSVQDVTGSRDGSNNLTISWIRRARIDGEVSWNDGVTEIPLEEASEQYSVDILDNAGAIKRTINVGPILPPSSPTGSGTGVSPTASYTAADQTTDFGSPQASVSLKVYQISGIVGRGFAQAASI